MHRLLFYIPFFIFINGQTQFSSKNGYPKNYFGKPLNIPVSLAGNFGDLRTNHYHMGLDYRTQQKENLAVLAAADGYVSHIKIEPYGYGRAIYITHPNGLVTLYAHLNNFYGALENYVRAKQYADKKWQQNFDVPPHLFPVKKGQFIAYSGNTGGSEGPHLHFEIRDAQTGNNYNPLLFGLGISDNVPPTVYRLAMYNRNQSIYETGPVYKKIRKKQLRGKSLGNEYESFDGVIKVPFGKFSFGFGAEDKTNESFMFGIYSAAIYLDNALACTFTMNDLSYDDSRYINAGIDYATRYNGGPYMHLLSKLPGNHIDIFEKTAGDGVLQLNDDTIHPIQIVIKDASGNSSYLRFNIQRDSLQAPKSVVSSEAAIKWVPNKQDVFENEAFSLRLHEVSLYDTVYTAHNFKPKQLPYVSAIHSVGNHLIPVHDSIEVAIKAKPNLAESIKQKTVVLMRSGRKFDVQKGQWIGDMVHSKWRNLGEYFLWWDTIKPILTPVNMYDSAVFIKDRKLVFKASDEIGDLRLFEGFIDGEWVIFRQKNNLYTYDFDDSCLPGWHTIKAVATDAAGNTKEYNGAFHNGIVPKTQPKQSEQ